MASQVARAVLKIKPHIPLIKFRGKLGAEHPAPTAASTSTTSTGTSNNNVVSTTMTSLFKRPLLPKEALEIIQVSLIIFLIIISAVLVNCLNSAWWRHALVWNKDKKTFVSIIIIHEQ